MHCLEEFEKKRKKKNMDCLEKIGADYRVHGSCDEQDKKGVANWT